MTQTLSRVCQGDPKLDTRGERVRSVPSAEVDRAEGAFSRKDKYYQSMRRTLVDYEPSGAGTGESYPVARYDYLHTTAWLMLKLRHIPGTIVGLKSDIKVRNINPHIWAISSVPSLLLDEFDL